MGSHHLLVDSPLCHSPAQFAAPRLPHALACNPLLKNRIQFPLSSCSQVSTHRHPLAFLARARKSQRGDSETSSSPSSSQEASAVPKDEKAVAASPPEDDYEEVEMSWIQEKAEDFYQMTGAAVNNIPGPRVGSTSLPWLLAVPIGYLSITFVIAVVRTILKYNSPKAKRKRLVGRNAYLCKSLDEFFPSRRLEFDSAKLKRLERETNFDTQEVLRKYIRYALNERPFNPDMVADFIHLRKVSQLDDTQIAEILNEVSRRIVKDKGVVLMNTTGLSSQGVKRKAAVQALFSKLLYLSELDEFCSEASRGSLQLKQIFGVTDEDANSIRIETLSEVADVESLEKMVSPSKSDTEEGEPQ